MKNKTLKSFLLLAATFALSIVFFTLQSFRSENKSVLDNTISDFSLKNVDEKTISLSDYKNAKGFIIVFTCNHCPFAKLYSQRFNDLNTKYSSLGVPLLAINSMDTAMYEDESFINMKNKSTTEIFNFPYLCDNMQTVGKNFGADHTPHAYVIWKENNKWKIKYSGAIDDNGEEPKKATPYVANAVTELLENKQVSMPVTVSVGCKIFFRK
ncbi:MAG: thioredoxin family protein [Flavobacteriales bacterium]|jgi:peroxiredoxin|nr:thioredoxin family protein [Crocinitomicaceae bacterium]NBW30985.1 thioredoxin family protein [Flavobacteriales bacterium]NDC93352.1 thioredoxin family protein [Flavobacteriales bacterium]